MGRGPARTRLSGIGGEQVEGRHALRALLDAGRRDVHDVWCSDAHDDLLDAARANGARTHVVSPDELAERAASATHQGVIARAAPLPEADVDDLLADSAAFVVALDGVTDPRNLGAVLRSAEAAGATGAVIPRHRSARITAAAAKAAAGAIEYLPIAAVSGIPAFLDRARRAQVWSVGLDADAPTTIGALDVADAPLVLVLGSEGRGLGRLAAERCDLLARIPMVGRTPSLNVSAAAAIACFEIARRRIPSESTPE